MRTTLLLDDDAFSLAQSYAKARSLTLGQAISELTRRGSRERLPLRKVAGAWVIDLPAGTPTATERQVKSWLDEAP